MWSLLIIFALVSILFSFLCSVWEAVLLSITPSYINVQKQEGSQLGTDLEVFKDDIDRPLSAILTLNTIAHTAGAIGVGAQAAVIFSEKADLHIGPLGISFESIVAVVMTLAILIGSEIIPKTIGANMWKQLAPFTVKSLKILMFILKPLVWLSQLITKYLKKDKEKSVLSRVDFMAMTRAGEESGALAANESEIIKNLLRFDRIPVRSIMTPRTVAVMAKQSQTVQEFYDSHHTLRFSRIPIYEKSRDEVTGLILKDDVLEHMIQGHQDWPLSKIKKEIMAVDQDKRLPELFDALTQNRTHLAIVVDEFGGLAGLVTMEDVLETLLGMEIVDEMDAVADLQDLARKKWEERARQLGLIE
ncbi:MAG TPA: CNNM domain-containing protein [Saprospiraceae bacterium]|nr:CNNM domain-containing protein [Saprospiraceae bacterium]